MRLVELDDFLLDLRSEPRDVYNIDYRHPEYNEYGYSLELIEQVAERQNTISGLGRLGQLMLPYEGCPRGPMGERGTTGDSNNVDIGMMCLDSIKDVDGNRWVPVLEQDLNRIKKLLKQATDVGGDV